MLVFMPKYLKGELLINNADKKKKKFLEKLPEKQQFSWNLLKKIYIEKSLLCSLDVNKS